VVSHLSSYLIPFIMCANLFRTTSTSNRYRYRAHRLTIVKEISKKVRCEGAHPIGTFVKNQTYQGHLHKLFYFLNYFVP
jgi:hypothetical protein